MVSTIADRSRTAYALAAWVARQPDIQGLLADRNRDGLLAATLAVYEFVKEEINLDQFQFHLPPAISFLRLHQPDKFGDDLRAIRPRRWCIPTRSGGRPSASTGADSASVSAAWCRFCTGRFISAVSSSVWR
ncbi:MAG: hypothetical protein JW781_01335 [Deltaproteobacteria bacterium]|nr:hypothetical protein [Candidatus Anaeroferrophillacea bacterium]